MFERLRKFLFSNNDAINQLRNEQPKRLRFEMSATAIKVDIVGEIDAWWGYGVRELQYQLAQAPNKPVEVYIHSGGGDLVEGIAIANTLRNHAGKVTTIGVGMVGSAATVIHAAADEGEAKLMEGATYMIHEVSAYGGGRSKDLAHLSQTIEQFNGIITDMYAAKIAHVIPDAHEQIKNMMSEETYMTAEQAVALGFADAIHNPTKILNMEKPKTALDEMLAKAKLLNEAPVIEPDTDVATDDVEADVDANAVANLQAENAQLTEALTNAITALSGLTNRVTALEKARNLTNTQKTVEAPKAANPLEKAQQVLNAAIAAKNQN